MLLDCGSHSRQSTALGPLKHGAETGTVSRSEVTELPFFASPVTFGPRGVERARATAWETAVLRFVSSSSFHCK